MSGWQLYAIAVFMGLAIFLSWKAQLTASVEQVAWSLVIMFVTMTAYAVLSVYLFM